MRFPINIFGSPHWESQDCSWSIKISEIGKNQQTKITNVYNSKNVQY